MEIFITVKVLVATAITICGPKDVKGSLPGKWGPWSEVSACSTSCGMGVHERKRIWETNPPQKSPFTMTHTIACYEGSCTENQSSAACADKETCTRQAKIEDCNLTGSWSSTNCPALCGLCLRVQGSPTSAIQMDSIVPTALMQAYVTADTTEYSGGAISTSGKRANENLNEVQVAGIVVGISIIVTIAIVAFCIFWVKKGKRMLRAPRRRPSRKSSIRRSLKRKPAESVMNYPDLNVTSDLDDDIRLSHFERSRPSIRHDRNDVSCLQETVLHETNSKEQARRSPPTSTYYHLSVADHLSDSDFSYPI